MVGVIERRDVENEGVYGRVVDGAKLEKCNKEGVEGRGYVMGARQSINGYKQNTVSTVR